MLASHRRLYGSWQFSRAELLGKIGGLGHPSSYLLGGLTKSSCRQMSVWSHPLHVVVTELSTRGFCGVVMKPTHPPHHAPMPGMLTMMQMRGFSRSHPFLGIAPGYCWSRLLQESVKAVEEPSAPTLWKLSASAGAICCSDSGISAVGFNVALLFALAVCSRPRERCAIWIRMSCNLCRLAPIIGEPSAQRGFLPYSGAICSRLFGCCVICNYPFAQIIG